MAPTLWRSVASDLINISLNRVFGHGRMCYELVQAVWASCWAFSPWALCRGLSMQIKLGHEGLKNEC